MVDAFLKLDCCQPTQYILVDSIIIKNYILSYFIIRVSKKYVVSSLKHSLSFLGVIITAKLASEEKVKYQYVVLLSLRDPIRLPLGIALHFTYLSFV